MRGLILSVVLALALATAGAGCGASECENLCWEVKPKLMDNFGIPEHRIDCAASKWEGDCDHCRELMKREFDVQITSCEQVLPTRNTIH